MTWYSSKSIIQKKRKKTETTNHHRLYWLTSKLKICFFQTCKNKQKVFLFKLLKSSISLPSLRVYYILDFLDLCTCKHLMIQEHWSTC